MKAMITKGGDVWLLPETETEAFACECVIQNKDLAIGWRGTLLPTDYYENEAVNAAGE